MLYIRHTTYVVDRKSLNEQLYT